MTNLNIAEILIAKSENQRWILSDRGGCIFTCAHRIVNCIKLMKFYLGVQRTHSCGDWCTRIRIDSTLYLLRYRSQQPPRNYPFLYFNTTMVQGHNLKDFKSLFLLLL